MSRTPSFAVVLEGGLVQAILVEDWPDHQPLPPFAVVDYDTEGADDDEITRFPIGDSEAEAACRIETPTVHEKLIDSLSPRAVLKAIGVADDGENQSPLEIARRVRREILDLDAEINASEQPPTGEDYNALYVLANCGLIKVLKSQGDTCSFAE